MQTYSSVHCLCDKIYQVQCMPIENHPLPINKKCIDYENIIQDEDFRFSTSFWTPFNGWNLLKTNLYISPLTSQANFPNLVVFCNHPPLFLQK